MATTKYCKCDDGKFLPNCHSNYQILIVAVAVLILELMSTQKVDPTEI